MILIGKIKSLEKDTAIVYCEDIDADIECMLIHAFNNKEDIIYRTGEQVAIYKQNGRCLLLGAVYSEHTKPNLTTLFKHIIEILKTIKVSTPQGASGTPLPDVMQKINTLEKDFKTFLNVK